jgi:drug/metabolite transporter (DMT)-like permease
MRLAALVAVTMVAFAANSLLNRMALVEAGAAPAAFALLRVLSGAVALWFMARRSGQTVALLAPGRALPAAVLTLYLLGFSFAYLTLDAGIGALILFGGVQITMFSGALIAGERPPVLRWLGMVAGVAGLGLLCWPSGAVQVDVLGASLMGAAALGWGIYSLIGRGSTAPLADTAASFVLATPLVLAGWLVSGETASLPVLGIGLAIVSGVVTSGMGYALWYSVLPRLDASVAALAQLTVPVIAIVAGAALLAEAVDLRTVLSAALVLGGVAVGILGSRAKTG